MKSSYFLIPLLSVALLCSGCASSERMLRLGANHTNYSQPEKERVKGYNKNTRKDLKSVGPVKNTEEDIARDTNVDKSLVNLWPFYLANSQYTSILWPMLDWDDYGFAFRPFYNQEGMEYSVLFPISAWNPHNKDGWIGNFYWNPSNIGAIPLFNTPKDKGFHYYGPVWRRTGNHTFYDSGKKQEVPCCKWGIFPLLWMNMGYKQDYCTLFPIAGWDSKFDLQNNLNYFGPFWNKKQHCGIFPIFRLNYGKDGKLNSYLIPIYIWRKDMFLSIPYSWHESEGEGLDYKFNVLNSCYSMKVQKSAWYSAMLAFWGKDKGNEWGDNGDKALEYRYFGFFPLFKYADMDEWYEFGMGPFNWLFAWNKGPNVTRVHSLGYFGFYSNDHYNRDKTYHTSELHSLLLFRHATTDRRGWDPAPLEDYYNWYNYTVHTHSYQDLVRQLREKTNADPKKEKNRRERIQAGLRILQIPDPMPKTQQEAKTLADKITKEHFTKESHEVTNFLLPLWYYSTNDADQSRTFALPFLASKWAKSKRSSNTYIGTPLLYQNKHFKGNAVQIINETDIEDMTDYHFYLKEYSIFKLLTMTKQKFQYLCWKGGDSSKLQKQRDSILEQYPSGKASWEETLAKVKKFDAENTILRNYTKDTFLSDHLYCSMTSDAGEERMYLLNGLLSEFDKVNDSEDLHVLGFLYRYQKKNDAERRFIFPFILMQKDAKRESFSFCWRLFDCEYENGKHTGGHIFFIPF